MYKPLIRHESPAEPTFSCMPHFHPEFVHFPFSASLSIVLYIVEGPIIKMSFPIQPQINCSFPLNSKGTAIFYLRFCLNPWRQIEERWLNGTGQGSIPSSLQDLPVQAVPIYSHILRLNSWTLFKIGIVTTDAAPPLFFHLSVVWCHVKCFLEVSILHWS